MQQQQFRVVDLRTGVVEPEQEVVATTPEQAAELTLGMKLVRAGNRKNLTCRVYWASGDKMNMVRLYGLSAGNPPNQDSGK